MKAALSKSFARTEAQMDIIHEDAVSPNEESSGFEDEERGHYQNFIPTLADENFGFNDSHSSSEDNQEMDLKLPASIYSHPQQKRLSKKQERELAREE